MDPLSALGLVAAVFQLVDFGCRVMKKGINLHAIANCEKDEVELISIAGNLSTLLHVNEDDPERPSSQAFETAGEAQLRHLRTESVSIINELQNMFRSINGHQATSGTGKRTSSKAQLRFLSSLWRAPDIDKFKERLEELRSQVVASVLFCIWDESKQSKQRELHFGQQLKDMTEMLYHIEQAQRKSELPASPEPFHVMADFPEAMDDDVFKRPTPILAPLIDKFGVDSLPAREIRKLMNDTLQGDSNTAIKIRSELIRCLWAKNWNTDHSATATSPQLSTTIAKAISKSLRFEAIQARAEAITDNFGSTCYWIFQKHPPTEHGQPLWPSFPEWLESNIAKQYWITGKPGSGKSTMMKFIYNNELLEKHLHLWASGLPCVKASFYAWNAGFMLQKSVEGLKRTLLTQAIELDPKLAHTLAPRRWTFLATLRNGELTPPRWESWEIDESFSRLLSECGKTLVLALFIDGLDEFDTPPEDIITLIREMVKGCKCGLKLCVASRPWYEFDDAFNDGPHLQMHLRTKKDMELFVISKLNNNRGFLEIQQIYPKEITDLMNTIVSKANGVFLWESLVVNDLSLSLSEGASIDDLKETLNILPSDLSDLYDSIWTRIPTRNIYDASFMVQLLMAAHIPMRWLLMWVANESRTALVDLNARPPSDAWKPAAWKNLKRRLVSRTRGILETSEESFWGDGGLVDFAHRTARDWALQPKVWKEICSATQDQDHFDPYLALIQAEAIILSSERDRAGTYDEQWRTVTRALWYGSQVHDTAQNTEKLVRALDELNCAAVDLKWIPPRNASRYATERWVIPDRQNHVQAARVTNTFLGMTAQFAILPYIKSKVESNPSLLCEIPSRTTLGLLECAIFGYKYYLSDFFSLDRKWPDIHGGQKLRLIEYLLGQGIKVNEAHCDDGFQPIRDLVRSAAKGHVRSSSYQLSAEDGDYFSKVGEYLDGRSFKMKWRSMLLRLRSR